MVRVIASSGLTNATSTVGPVEVVQRPKLESPGSLEFGNVTVGSGSVKELTLRNTGSGPLTVKASLPDATPFHGETPRERVIPSEGSQTLSIEYAPATKGTDRSVLTIECSDPERPKTEVTLIGNAFDTPEPSIEVTPRSLGFGAVAIGQRKELTFEVANSGSADLNVTRVTSDNGRFTIPSAAAFSVTAGANKTVTVRFEPTSAVAERGTITVASNDPTRAGITVSVTGEGTGSAGAAGYKLSRIEVNRTFVDPNWSKGIGVLPGRQTLGASERAFQMGWEFTWPAETNANRNRASALVKLTSVPASVSPGAAAQLGASITGDWFTSGGYGVARDHTVTLEGAAGAGRWSTVEDPNGTYRGSVSANNSAPTPNPDSSGEIAFTISAKLQFGGDHWAALELKLVYTQSGSGPASCSYGLGQSTGSLSATGGTGSVNVSASPSSCQWAAVISTAHWLTITSGLSYTGPATVTFTAQANTGSNSRTGTLTIAGLSYTVTQAGTSGSGGGPTSRILFSDSFDRTASDVCALGATDLRLGGNAAYNYIPIWPGSPAQGARISGGWLVNGGQDYGGVQFANIPGGCSGSRGADIGQDLDISMDVVVPSSDGSITQAGPYFRSRAASAGDGIIGGTSAGYWVQLNSTGAIGIKRLNPQETIAASAAPARFDSAATHSLRTLVAGTSLSVWLDGEPVAFTQGGQTVRTVTVGPTSGTNNGTAGISFGAETNRGRIGGQRIRNLVVGVPSR